MKCPNCNHVSDTALLRCSECGETYDRDALQTLGHLEYLLEWLDGQAGTLGQETHARLRREASARLDELRAALLPVEEEPAPAERPVEEVGRELALFEAASGLLDRWCEAGGAGFEAARSLRHFLWSRSEELGGEISAHAPETPPADGILAEQDAVDFVIESLPGWVEDGHILPEDADSLRRYLEPAPAPEPAPPSASIKPTPAPGPPPAPGRPPVEWGKIWQKAVDAAASGALLHGLLYLGAFMIVVSAAILVVRFWDIFPKPVQLGFIAFLPTAFYVAGWGIRARLRLPQAGGVITGIGALLVAVDFAAVYQLGGFIGGVDRNAYWLGASVFCTALYAATAWRLPEEFFDYITLLGGGSAVLALSCVVGLPLEWDIASVTFSSLAMIVIAVGAVRFGHTGGFAAAARRLPQVLMPVSMAVVLFVPGDSSANISAGQAATFAFAALGYGLLAWRFPSTVKAHAAVYSSAIAGFFTVRAFDLQDKWYAAVAAAAASPYILAGKWMSSRLRDDFRQRRGYLLAVYIAGFGLLSAAVLLGFVTVLFYLWASVLALTLASMVLAGCAYLFRRPAFVLVSGGLFVVPVTLAALQLFEDFDVSQQGAWLMTAWAVLALGYLVAAALLRRAEKYAVYLNLLAHLLAPAVTFGLVVNYVSTPYPWASGPTLAALGGVILAYAVSAVIHDSGRHPALSGCVSWLPGGLARSVFMWPVGFLVPVWVCVFWADSPFELSWLGAALALLALGYVGLGELLARRRVEYRLPPHVYAYVLAVVAIPIPFALEDRWALLVSLHVVVCMLGVLAFVYRRPAEIAVAVVLYLWPFWLSLELSPLAAEVYSMAYVLLGSVAYIALGVALDGKYRAGRKYALPAYIAGDVVSALAVAYVLFGSLGRLRTYAASPAWVRFAVPMVVACSQAFQAYRFRRVYFAWAAAIASALAFGGMLVLVPFPREYDAAAWVCLAFAYLLLGRWFSRAEDGAWFGLFKWPLGVGSALLCALGLALTAGATALVLSRVGRGIDGTLPVIAPQVLAAAFTVLAARLYRSRWPVYVEPWLAFFPVTVFFVGYGEFMFGRALSVPEYGIVWAALGTAHLAAGALLDRSDVRYSHGLYVGGYVLVLLGVLWDVLDRGTLLWTLGTAIVLALVSHLLVHYGKHRSFDDLVRLIWREEGTTAHRAARTLFLFFAAYALPVWLAEVLTYREVPLAWRGVSLALAAPLYVAAGLRLRRVRSEYTWPLYSAGYALTAIGAMVTFDDLRLAIYVLALDAAVYAVSAYIFRRPFWLYLSNTLVPVIALLTLHYNDSLSARWVAGVFMALAFAYFGAGRWFDRRVGGSDRSVSPYALPFYAPGYLLSAAAMAVASGERNLAIAVYSAGVVLHALSAWAFREAVFLYPAAWLAAVPYYLVMTLTPLPTRWYGLGWLPMIAGYVALGRLVFHGRPISPVSLRTLPDALAHPALPFYLLAHGLTVSMVALSVGDPVTLTWALVAATAVYFASAAIFRRAAWLYPGLLSAHAALLAYLSIHPGGPVHYITLPFTAMTWATALAGYAFSRGHRLETADGPRFKAPPSVRYLLEPSWAQPFVVFAALDVAAWQLLALRGDDTAIIIAASHMLLAGLFAMLWRDDVLPYGAVGFLLLAAGYRLVLAYVHVAAAFAWVGGIGFLLYVMGLAAEQVDRRRGGPFSVWPVPLANSATLLTALAVVATLPFVASHTSMAAAALGFAGTLHLTIAYRRRGYYLGYFGVALLEFAWSLALISRDVAQPQYYAVPAGLYFVGVGVLERSRGRGWFATLVESFGLCVLLLTSFIQSLEGATGFPYFLLLLVEALAVVWWGASRRVKIPFFVGIGASVLNVVAQVVILVNVHRVNRWFIIFGVGLLLTVVAVFVERKREQIAARAKEWLEVLDRWE